MHCEKTATPLRSCDCFLVGKPSGAPSARLVPNIRQQGKRVVLMDKVVQFSLKIVEVGICVNVKRATQKFATGKCSHSI